MSFTSRSPQPTLVWQFQSSNVETITRLAPTFSTTSGSLTSAPTYVTGKSGQAISFSNETAGAGANSYITYSLSSSFSPTSFTWAYWVNYRQIPVQSFQTPLYFTDSLASTTDFVIAIGPAGTVPGNGQQPFIFGSGSFLLAPALSQGVWRHFCIVLTPGSGGSTATWYSDGTLVGSTVFTNNQTATINGMSVGARFIPGTGASEGAICYVDDLRLFNRALTAAEVQAVYAVQGVYAGNITSYTGVGIVSPITGATSMNRIYSLQRVNKTYSGNIINLRRSSDSVNVDFVTNSTNTNLVTASGGQTLASWLGAATANTVIWYDQSGNGRNLVQTTSTAQPGFSATTGVQFRTGLYMAFPDTCVIGDATILTGFTQNAYLYGNPSAAWYFQDAIISGERGGGTDDWGLVLNGSGKFGFGVGPTDTQCSISTNGLGSYSLMTGTRVSSTGVITLYNGSGSGSAFTLSSGSKFGPTPTLMGWNQSNNLQYMNSDMASFFWFDDVKNTSFISSVASTFTTPTVPNLDAAGTGIVSLTSTALFYQLPVITTASTAVAYSLRAVNGATPIAVQVRRSTDNATQNFYADSRGNLLTAPVTGQTLASWLGAATGYVTTWYDQSGAGNNATQATTASQPTIQKATKGPGYSVYFSGSSQYLIGPSYTVLNNTNYTISMVDRRASSTTNDLCVFSCGVAQSPFGNTLLHNIYRSGTSFINGQFSNDNSVTISAYNAGNEPAHYSFSLCSTTSGRNIYFYGDSLGNPIKNQSTTQTTQLSMLSGNVNLGYMNNSGVNGYYIGEIFEIIVFKTSAYDTDGTTGTNVPTTVQTIYNNQSAYYT